VEALRKFLFTSVALWFAMGAPAHADPLTLAFSTLIGGITAGQVGTVLAGFVINLGFKTLMDAFFGPKDPKEKGTEQVMENGADKPPRIILGTHGTSGHLLYQNSYDDDANRWVAVIILSALRVAAISSRLNLSGQRCTIDWETVDSEGFSPVDEYQKFDTNYCRVKFHAGAQSAADPWLVDKFGDDPNWEWTNDMLVKGCAYVIVECRASRKGVWATQPTFIWTVQGMPLYDPRRDSSIGGSGSHRWNNVSTWGGPGDDNPKVQIYNIIRGFPDIDGSHFWGGRVGGDAYRMPVDYWFAAMNTCDEDVELKSGDIIRRYKSSLEIFLDEEPFDVIMDIDRGCNGFTTEYGGTYKSFCGAPGLSVMTITDADFMITEKRTDDLFKPIEETYNSAITTYPEPNSGWTMEPGPLYVDDDYVEEDDDEPMQLDIELRCVTNVNQVMRVQRAVIKDSRAMLSHQGVLPPEAFILEPHDRISYQSVDNGYHGDGVDFTLGSKAHRPNVFQEVSIRSINPNAQYWVKEMELDHTVGKMGVIRSGALDVAFSIAPGQVDSATGKDKPAIDVTWSFGSVDTDIAKVLWKVRRTGTTAIIANGTIHDLTDGFYQIRHHTLRFKGQYEVQFEPVPISLRESEPTAWQSVTCVVVDVPAAPSLTRVSKLAHDGTLDFFLDVQWIKVAAEATYIVRLVSDGVTHRFPSEDNTRRIPVTSGDACTVDVAAVVNGDRGDYSSTSTITVSKKSTNDDPPTGLTATTNRHGEIILRLTRGPANKDFKRFNIYEASVNNFTSASLLDDTAASRFVHDDLPNGVDRWHWATTVDKSDNESAKYPASNTGGVKGSTIRLLSDDLAAGAVEDANTSQAAPNIPPVPVLASYTGDIDDNGTIDQGLTITLTAPTVDSTHPKAVRYVVQLWRSMTIGTGYTFWKRYVTDDLVFEKYAPQKYFYKAIVRGISFSGAKGAFSTLPAGSTGVQPAKYLGSIPTPTALNVIPQGGRMVVSFDKPTFKGFKETIIFVDGVEAHRIKTNAWTDPTVRTAGTGYAYSAQHVDSQDRVGAVCTAVTATYRLLNSAELGVGAVAASNTDGTVLVAPGSVLLVQDDQDVNGDGTIDIACTVTWAPVTGAVRYLVEVSRATVLGGPYTVIGRGGLTSLLVWTFPANTTFFYKVRVRAFSFNGTEGTWSGLTAGLKPLPKPGAPSDVAGWPDYLAMSIDAIYKNVGFRGVVLGWGPCPDLDFDRTEIWDSETNDILTAEILGTSVDTTYVDTFNRVNTPEKFYWLRHVNTSEVGGNYRAVSTSSLGGLPVNTSEIALNAINERQIASTPSNITCGAGVDKLLESLPYTGDSTAQYAEFLIEFHNVSGSAKTMDMYLYEGTIGSGTLLKSWPSLSMSDNNYQPLFYTDFAPPASETYRLYANLVSGGTINRVIMQAFTRNR
jgi:hypothetical protein